MTKDTLITGHPRSGTGYASEMFKHYGFDIGHEKMGSDGISSWIFAPENASKNPYRRIRNQTDYEFKTIIHIIRNPVDVVNSMAFTVFPDDRVVKYMLNWIDIDRKMSDLYKSIQTYIGWNKLITSRKPDVLIKVEELDKYLTDNIHLCPLKGHEPPTDYNTRKHDKLSMDEIRSELSGYTDLIDEFVRYSEELGYVI